MIVVGVDPGLSGAVALYATGGSLLWVNDMPTFSLSRSGKSKREIDTAALARMIGHQEVAHAFIEQAGSRPGQNVSGVFASGKNYGIVIGILAALHVPTTFVHPRVWKKGLGVPADKDGARSRASQLLPAHAALWARVKDDGRAEASLIALFGARAMNAIAKVA